MPIIFVPTWEPIGVQVNTPLAELRLTLNGAEVRLKANELGGLSGSAAELVKLRVMATARVRLEMGASTGGWLVRTTMTVKLCVALKGGVPLSVTSTLTVLVPSCVELGAQENAPVAGSRMALVGAPAPRLKAS